MLPRYFNAMVRHIKQSGLIANAPALREYLYTNGFTKAEISEHLTRATTTAQEHIDRAKANGGKLPVRVRIYDVATDTEENTFVIDNYLRHSADTVLRNKILFAVNNGKTVEICSIAD